MSYEKHLCSIKHLLTELDPTAASEAAAEVVEDDTNEKSNKDDQEASDDDFDFNPDDFITLDEVGDDEDQDEPLEVLAEGMQIPIYLYLVCMYLQFEFF